MICFLSILYIIECIWSLSDITNNKLFSFIIFTSLMLSVLLKFREYLVISSLVNPSVFEIFEYRPYKRNAKQIKINIARKITVNFKKLLLMNETYTHKLNINKELSSIRLDKVLTKKLEKYSRMQIKMLIKNGNVKLNNDLILLLYLD